MRRGPAESYGLRSDDGHGTVGLSLTYHPLSPHLAQVRYHCSFPRPFMNANCHGLLPVRAECVYSQVHVLCHDPCVRLTALHHPSTSDNPLCTTSLTLRAHQHVSRPLEHLIVGGGGGHAIPPLWGLPLPLCLQRGSHLPLMSSHLLRLGPAAHTRCSRLCPPRPAPAVRRHHEQHLTYKNDLSHDQQHHIFASKAGR